MNLVAAIVGRVLLLAAIGYLILCLYVFFRQRAMLYHPRPVSEEEMLRQADTIGLVRWKDKAGNLLGWVTAGEADGTPVLVFHGNAGTALDRTGLLERLRLAGVKSRICLMDYPGYGSAPGEPSGKTLVAAALRALDAFPGPVIVVGESLGTGVASQAVAERSEKIRGLILITPFDSMVSAASHHYPWLPVGLLLVDRFDSVRALQKFSGPTALLLADRDGTTPPEGARRLFESLPGRKKLWEAKNADHNEAIFSLPDEEWRRLWEFVSE